MEIELYILVGTLIFLLIFNVVISFFIFSKINDIDTRISYLKRNENTADIQKQLSSLTNSVNSKLSELEASSKKLLDLINKLNQTSTVNDEFKNRIPVTLINNKLEPVEIEDMLILLHKNNNEYELYLSENFLKLKPSVSIDNTVKVFFDVDYKDYSNKYSLLYPAVIYWDKNTYTYNVIAKGKLKYT